ncbi:hypothetical protein HMN09_01215200 [Mycena chlorophos]|uniref:Uncharacterized protein n=1 Tax=Mycena chlorophos TaxID=658473 RepID=A0A8H6S6P6_MYCCL|nr:hypothetical protein HMN09_01215200 [Mycena chlorophos]
MDLDQDIDTDALQAQIDLSLSYAQNLASSWVKPSKKSPAKNSNEAIEAELKEYMRRPPRLGVGADIPAVSNSSRDAERLKSRLSGKNNKRARDEGDEPESKDVGDDDEDGGRGASSKKKARLDPFAGLGKKKRKEPVVEAPKPKSPSPDPDPEAGSDVEAPARAASEDSKSKKKRKRLQNKNKDGATEQHIAPLDGQVASLPSALVAVVEPAKPSPKPKSPSPEPDPEVDSDVEESQSSKKRKRHKNKGKNRAVEQLTAPLDEEVSSKQSSPVASAAPATVGVIAPKSSVATKLSPDVPLLFLNGPPPEDDSGDEAPGLDPDASKKKRKRKKKKKKHSLAEVPAAE